MNEKPHDGGPAFPRPGFCPSQQASVYDAEEYSVMCQTITRPQPGMSYADWIAGRVMVALVSQCSELPTDDELQIIARRALAAARALIHQRGVL